jgi:hypothetical protein
MKWLAALPLLMALISSASANTFRLECLDADDGKTRLAVIEVNTDAATVRVYSESEQEWKPAVNVAISDVTFSYVEHQFNNLASAATNHQPRERQIRRLFSALRAQRRSVQKDRMRSDCHCLDEHHPGASTPEWRRVQLRRQNQRSRPDGSEGESDFKYSPNQFTTRVMTSI